MPNTLYIDLDNRSKKYFVLGRIEKILPGTSPTVLDSGCGLSFIVPVDSAELLKCLEPVAQFQPLKKLLRFCSQELTGGHADSGHNPSINSSMVRVPGTINSRNGAKVTVLQQWNGHRASLMPLYHPFINCLMDERRRESYAIPTIVRLAHVDYIEKLLKTPIYSGREVRGFNNYRDM